MTDFELIENLFSQLLPKLREVLSESEIEEFNMFLEAGEYGLALETVVDVIKEKKKVITPEFASFLSKIGREMSMDVPSMLNGITD